ncbi:tail terminator [Mycobacterium phage OlanP]|nr:tail terminator [Mycobacterium phage OlanP]QFP95261.1 tail terminator [Mycobacterium phage JeppNRM]
MAKMPRVQAVVLPILRAALPDVKVGSWIEDIDYRTFPMVNVRRVGGPRHETRPDKLALPVIEMTAYGREGLVETEKLYEDALEALYDAVKYQTQTPAGYLHSIKETMGATQFSSLFQDSWRVQGLIQLGVRPPRS